MRLDRRQLGIRKRWITTALIGLLIPINTDPANAFIPYIYEPNPIELKDTGLSIGKTAAQLIHLGQAKEAIRLAELAVKLNPEDERLWSVLAEAQLRRNLISEAETSLGKAKALNPNNAGIWLADASLALKQINPDKAIILINEGLKLDSKNAGAYFQLGNARIIESKNGLALKSYKKALSLTVLQKIY